MKMIIGEFADVYPPTIDEVGRVCCSCCETLKKMGHQVYYIAPYKNYNFDTSVPAIFLDFKFQKNRMISR